MAKVEIYTKQTCPFCIRAKELLDNKNVSYDEIRIDGDQEKRAAMIARADGRQTVPQIFINDEGVGGCDELHMLDRQGKLDGMLNA